MTDTHTDNHPAQLDHEDAQSARRSSKFRMMFYTSTTLIVAAMVTIFLLVSG